MDENQTETLRPKRQQNEKKYKEDMKGGDGTREERNAKRERNCPPVFIHPVKPCGHYMYHQFNTQQLYVLPTQCI